MSDKNELLSVAGRLVSGMHLSGLSVLCETQNTVSTRKLNNALRRVEEYLRKEGVEIRRIYDNLK